MDYSKMEAWFYTRGFLNMMIAIGAIVIACSHDTIWVLWYV